MEVGRSGSEQNYWIGKDRQSDTEDQDDRCYGCCADETSRSTALIGYPSERHDGHESGRPESNPAHERAHRIQAGIITSEESTCQEQIYVGRDIQSEEGMCGMQYLGTQRRNLGGWFLGETRDDRPTGQCAEKST